MKTFIIAPTALPGSSMCPISASALSMAAMVAMRSFMVSLPMWPTRTVLPPSFPSPPAMMTLYLLYMMLLILASSMPSGILGTVSVWALLFLPGKFCIPRASIPAMNALL